MKFGDRFIYADSIEMWEGTTDKPADVHVAANILECRPDVDDALMNIKARLASSRGQFRPVPGRTSTRH